MSGALPSVDFTAVKISSNQKTLVSTTDSGKTFRRQVQGQRWQFSCVYKQQPRLSFQSIMSFIIKQRSQKESFTITFPNYLDANGNESGTVLVNGVHAVGDTTIAMDGFHADGTHRFRAGDFIKFAHSKVYMVVEDVTSSSNASTVTIEPPLTTALANDEAVTYDDVPFTVHLTSDLQEFPMSNGDSDGEPLHNFEFDVIESI